MKYLRCVGLVSTLLIGGVLGGLMAPLPSEAAPTLTLQIDSGPVTPILGAGGQACPTGFNQCFAVGGTATGGNPSQSYTVSAAPGAQPRLNLADFAAQDAAKVTGIKIAPTVTSFPATETHVLRIVMTNTFNAITNPAGNYIFALRSGGYLQAGGTPSNTQYDYVKLEGKGTFSSTLVNVPLLNVAPSTTNRAPLSVQVGNVASATFFTLDQVVTYPTFNCNNGNNRCTPTITMTFTVTLKGSDVLVLSDSNDGLGGSCSRERDRDRDWDRDWDDYRNPDNHHMTSCRQRTNKILRTFTRADAVDVAAGVAAGAVRAIQCTGPDCPCADPDTCPAEPETGTITINKHIPCGDCVPTTTFTFNINGPSGSTQEITTNSNANDYTTTVTVNAGTYDVSEATPPSGWSLTMYPTPPSCNGGGTMGVVVPANGNVTCDFTNEFTPVGTITINKRLNVFCAGGCTGVPFTFHILGPVTDTMVTVTTDGFGNGTSGPVTVNADSGYSVTEASPSGWVEDVPNSKCDGIPPTSLTVSQNTNVTCTFFNDPTF